jgi:dTDP-4-amino-4,6-dideoxygalactose transaminase
MRSALQAHLSDAGIETLVHYPIPIPRQEAFDGVNPTQCPIADRVCNEVLSLPLHVGLRPSELTRVADAVQSFRAGTSNKPMERLS